MCTERLLAVLAGLLLAGTAPAQAPATPPQSFAEAVAAGRTALDLRWRAEFVDQDGIGEDAEASTLRLRLNHATAAYRDFGAFVEFDYVAELLLDEFNSGGGTSPDRTQYPVVADPHGGDLNQLYVDYTGLAATRLRIGRQRILLDNQRFVGGVGWRQNEQTYDGLSVRYDGRAGAVLDYAWIGRVNRIFGDRSPQGRDDSNTQLLNARFEIADGWTLGAYGYRIDDRDVPAFSTATVGARLGGSLPLGGRRLGVQVEGARQSDAANAPVDFNAGYFRLDLSLPVGEQLTLAAGYEALGGDADTPGQAFRTPLATLHAFQGWADQFLATPDAGVEDLFLSVTAKPGAWTLAATWHDFGAADGGADWGGELDLSAARRLGDRYGLLLKAALFDADSPAFADVGKAWLMLTAGW